MENICLIVGRPGHRDNSRRRKGMFFFCLVVESNPRGPFCFDIRNSCRRLYPDYRTAACIRAESAVTKHFGTTPARFLLLRSLEHVNATAFTSNAVKNKNFVRRTGRSPD